MALLKIDQVPQTAAVNPPPPPPRQTHLVIGPSTYKQKILYMATTSSRGRYMHPLACIEIYSRKRELFQKVSAVYFILGISRTNPWIQGIFCHETLRLPPCEESERANARHIWRNRL